MDHTVLPANYTVPTFKSRRKNAFLHLIWKKISTYEVLSAYMFLGDRYSVFMFPFYTVFQKKTCDHVFDDKLK